MQHRLAHRTEIALRQREDHRARLDLREHRERIDVIGVDDVADIDLTEADHAVDRRRNGGVIELGFCRLDGGLIGVDRRFCRVDFGLLGIDVLQRLGVPQHQRLEPRQVLLGVDQLRLVLALLGYGLIERGLEWRRIDFREHVAFTDVLALTEIDRDDLAVDLGAQRDGVEGLDRAEGVVIDRDVLLCRLGDNNGNRRRSGLCRFGAAVTPINHRGGHACHRDAYCHVNPPGFLRGHPRPHGLAIPCFRNPSKSFFIPRSGRAAR